MSMHNDLLRQIKAFLKANEMSESRFGRLALGDAAFFYDLRDGNRSPQLKTVERVKTFMRDYARAR